MWKIQGLTLLAPYRDNILGGLIFWVNMYALSIVKQFEKYFAANDASKGGSFYLQSKIYRAHELLTEFQKEKRKEEMNQQQ
jgi:hypothetical protein